MAIGIELEAIDFCIVFGALALCWILWCLLYNAISTVADKTSRLLQPKPLSLWQKVLRTPPIPFLISRLTIHKKSSWFSRFHVSWKAPSFLNTGNSKQNLDNFGVNPSIVKVMNRHLWPMKS